MDFRAIRQASASGAYIRRSGWIDRVWNRAKGLWWQTPFDQAERIFGAPSIVRADDVTPFDYLATDWTLEPIPELREGAWEGAPVSVEVEVRHALGAATRFGHRAYIGSAIYLTKRTWYKIYDYRYASTWYSYERYWKRSERRVESAHVVSSYRPGERYPIHPTVYDEGPYFDHTDYDVDGVLGSRTETKDGVMRTGVAPPDGQTFPEYAGWTYNWGDTYLIEDNSHPLQVMKLTPSLREQYRRHHRIYRRDTTMPQATLYNIEVESNQIHDSTVESLSDPFTDTILLDCALAERGNYGGEELTETLGGIVRDSHAGYERWTVRVGLYRLAAKVPPFESGRYRFVWGVRSPDGLIERFEEEVVPEWQATVCRTAERAFTPSAQIGDFRVVDAAAFWIE